MERLDHDTVAHCMRLKGAVVGTRFIEYKRLPERIKDYALHRPGIEAVRVNGKRVSFVWHEYEQPHHIDDAYVDYKTVKWKKKRRGERWK